MPCSRAIRSDSPAAFAAPSSLGSPVSGTPHSAAWPRSSSQMETVKSSAPPAAATCATTSSVRYVACSKHSIPASSPIRMASALCACAVTYVPLARASSTAARISATLNCVSSIASLCDTTPPETHILSCVAPCRNAIRAALRTSSGPWQT